MLYYFVSESANLNYHNYLDVHYNGLGEALEYSVVVKSLVLSSEWRLD